MAKLRRAVEEPLSVWQELLSLWRQRGAAAQAATLAVQLDAQPLLQHQQPAAQPLFGDVKCFRRGTQAPLPGKLHEGGDLIGRKRRKRLSNGHRDTSETILETQQ